MFKGLVKRVFGTKHDRDIKILRPFVDRVNSFEPEIEKLTDDELKRKTDDFKKALGQGKSLDEITEEAFAVVKEACFRVLKMKPFDVQVMGGKVLLDGKIAEMKTGEGKTLTATLPLYLKALEGKGAHLVTVNDYLAQRDARDMGEVYNWLGLSTGVIVNDMDDDDRKKAYQADITYGTNNEFAFDYLRDNMKLDLEDYVQREHYFCIVDEVDSILIDEARTPLLISGPSEGGLGLYKMANSVIPKLSKDIHYTVDEKSHTAILTDKGISESQRILKVENLFNSENMGLLHNLNQALKAHTLFKKDIDYVVKNGRVVIVDEFTGRLKEGSRWSDGLHQAVEAKEGVNIKSENQTLASITFQNYFKLYNRLSGMTGTAETEQEEFMKIYSLEVIVIPTNLPMIRDDMADSIYASKKGKYFAIANFIKDLNKKGQPILVGTISIDSSEILSGYLKKYNVNHEILNAKQHEREAQIILKAGEKNSVTIATNMAGRGTDIKLTQETKELGGLFIVGTERHESRRIDNQLRGRSGRQGDQGSSKFFLSLEDDLMRVFGSDRIKGIMTRIGMKEDEPIEHRLISNSIAKAQKRVENHNFEIRKHLLDFDNVMNEQRGVIYRLRREILSDNGNLELFFEMLEDVCFDLTSSYEPKDKQDQWSWDEISRGFKNLTQSDQDVSEKEFYKEFHSQEDIPKYLFNSSKDIINKKFSIYEEKEISLSLREILLITIDSFWKDHLLAMDHLKEGINLRSYGQKDPLVEYKREAFQLFESMKMSLKRTIIERVFSAKFYTEEEIAEIKKKQQELLDKQLSGIQKSSSQSGDSGKTSSKPNLGPKVGRNDPCPCGSGKKYKRCHGK